MSSSSTLLSFLLLLLLLPSALAVSQQEAEERVLHSRRTLKPPPLQEKVPLLPKKKPTTTTTTTVMNSTKQQKPKSTFNSTKLASLIDDAKISNSTKLPKLPKSSNSTKVLKPRFTNTTTAIKLPKSKSSNFTTLSGASNTTKLLKPKQVKPSNLTATGKRVSDLPPPSTPTTTQMSKSHPPPKKQTKSIPKPVPIKPWLDDDEDGDGDLMKEITTLPAQFQKAVVPDLRKISTTSKAYLHLASREFTRSFKPLVGTRYAPPLANVAFAVLLLLPLLLVTAVFRRLKAHLPLQKVLLSAHIYLAVYFSVLAAAGAAAGTEPLRFFHAASPWAYVGTQVMLMMAYLTYLLLQLVEVAAVGHRAAAAAAMRLALAMAVGVHYYAAVFHRAVHGEAPRTSWRVHAVYAACFATVCALAGVGRGKKAYAGGGGGDDGKTS